MPKIYVSPSFQDQNVGGGNFGTEEQRCNQIADVVERELKKNTNFIVVRNNPSMSLEQVIADSNASNADIHYSIHTNAGDSSARGCEVYAFAPNTQADQLAQIVYKRLSNITPATDRGVKYTNLAETRNTKAIAVLTEVGFHSNTEDANWIVENIETIGKELALALYDYYQIPYAEGNTTPVIPQPTTPSVTGKIAQIQQTLNQRYRTNLVIDNLYGPATKSALIRGLQTELNRQFQAQLNVDGIWGPRTKQASINVRRGAQGNITYIIQAALYCKGYNTNGVDGIFGSGTENAIRSFQAEQGLTVDGICGPNTFEKLLQ